jgi:hypothetical protein
MFRSSQLKRVLCEKISRIRQYIRQVCQPRFRLKSGIAIALCLLPFIAPIQATPPPPPPAPCAPNVDTITNCPNPEAVSGYLGNLGTLAGNCPTVPPLTLPPLCAFGSLSINQNSPLQSVNRLNCNQLPTTNNFQLFQNPCGIFQGTWTTDAMTGIGVGGGSKMRHGPFLVGMSQTGPVAEVVQYNINMDPAFPNISVDARTTFFFSALETNVGAELYFNITTNVVNSETCIVTYTPNNHDNSGFIEDYNLIGNVFHDVYYQDLTPELAVSNAPLVNGNHLLLSIDGGVVKEYAFGSTVTGHCFQFFVNRYTPLGPSSFLLYAVAGNPAGSEEITFTVVPNPGVSQQFIFTATAPYTGFLRLASLSMNGPAPVIGDTWTQTNFFMPEDVCDKSDTSVYPGFTPPGGCVRGSTISPCPIECVGPPCSPCSLMVTQENWWKTAQVHALSTTGMSFYMLLPTIWADLFSQLASNVIGPTWKNDVIGGNVQYPVAQALTDILPAIAMANYPLATTWYNNFINATYLTNGSDQCDFNTNFFLVLFDMIMAGNLAADISDFQTLDRPFPNYMLDPVGLSNVGVYTAHSLFVPVQANISTTSTSVTWTYLPSPTVPPPTGTKPLMCFPFWKSLQGLTSGVVETTPHAPDTGPLQNFIFNDTIKGTLYGAEGTLNIIDGSGSFTFLEPAKGIPTWYDPFSSNLFIPGTLAATLTPDQLSMLATALGYIQHTIIPLPYFPENFLDPAYNAGKTCFMLAKSALYIAYYMQLTGSTTAQIIAKTQPFADNAKSCLTAYLLGRTPGSSFFVADRTSGGICVNGAGGNGAWANGPNLQQLIPSASTTANLDTGLDFGNYIYNDHHFFAGYFLLASAMVTNWDMLYNPGNLWIEIPVMGADNQPYIIRDMIDFLWRDTHNPFTNDPTQPIYDPDIPYNRYGLTWEGHGVANGLQYNVNVLGRNQESIGEDFNCWLGMNTFAALVLQTTLTPGETARYQAVYDFSLMNLKLNASSGILWFKNPTYWIGEDLFESNPTSLSPAIYIGQFSQATVTNGEVNDQSAQNQTFF